MTSTCSLVLALLAIGLSKGGIARAVGGKSFAGLHERDATAPSPSGSG